jgi:hypothetical protein
MYTDDLLDKGTQLDAAIEHHRVRVLANPNKQSSAVVPEPSRRPVTLAIVSLLDFAR